jgi:hypothetical protein
MRIGLRSEKRLWHSVEVGQGIAKGSTYCEVFRVLAYQPGYCVEVIVLRRIQGTAK